MVLFYFLKVRVRVHQGMSKQVQYKCRPPNYGCLATLNNIRISLSLANKEIHTGWTLAV